MHRFELFDRYCFATVSQQTVRKFRWLVLFDNQTPNSLRSRIGKYQSAAESFEPVFLDDYSSQTVPQLVAARLAGTTKLITTRLDSDDAIAVDFVAEVQRIAEAVSAPAVINFDAGFVLADNRLYKHLYRSNPFASLVEDVTESREFPLTIHGASHSDLPSLGEVHHVRGKPMWLQVVHGANVSNSRRGLRCRRQAIGNRYSILFPQANVPEPLLDLLSEGVVTRLAQGIGGLRKAAGSLKRLLKKPGTS